MENESKQTQQMTDNVKEIQEENSKGRKGKKTLKISLALITIVGVLFLGLFLGGFFKANDSKSGDGEGNPNNFSLSGGQPYDPGKYKNVKMRDGIDIYGFDELDFKANSKVQKNCGIIQNPKGNTSFMKISLILTSGKDKGKVLWETGNALLEPGLAYNTIELKNPLKKGKYKAVVKYECFSVKDLSPQNGSEINITLNVK